MKEILFEKADVSYKKFHAKLIPDIDDGTIIGVRIPEIRKIAKEYANSKARKRFLQELPHKYYEENNLHAFFIAQIKNFEECIYELERFLPYIDNWATCDSLRPVCFGKNKDKLIKHIYKWMSSEHEYTVRFGIEMLMIHFLDKNFDKSFSDAVSLVKSEHYYVKMMVAWYFATALSKRWDEILPYIADKKLDEWTHNKAIQKAIESYRINDVHKKHLRTLKIKTN